MKTGAVILSGGKSSRMGKDKAFLELCGDSFLKRLQAKFSGFEELLLSVGDTEKYKDCGMTLVSDIYKDCGPIGGLHAALNFCRSDALLAVACDMPLFDYAVVEYLLSKDIENYDAIVAVLSNGRAQPLCSIYKKSAAAIFEAQILKGEYRMMNALKLFNICQAPISEADIPDQTLLNINNGEDYLQLIEKADNNK